MVSGPLTSRTGPTRWANVEEPNGRGAGWAIEYVKWTRGALFEGPLMGRHRGAIDQIRISTVSVAIDSVIIQSRNGEMSMFGKQMSWGTRVACLGVVAPL